MQLHSYTYFLCVFFLPFSLVAQDEQQSSDTSKTASTAIIKRILSGYDKNKNLFKYGRVIQNIKYGYYETMDEFKNGVLKGKRYSRNYERAIQENMFLIKRPDENGCEAGVIGTKEYAIAVDGNQRAIIHSNKINPIDNSEKPKHLYFIGMDSYLDDQLFTQKLFETNPDLIKHTGTKEIEGNLCQGLSFVDYERNQTVVAWFDENRGYLPILLHTYPINSMTLKYERRIWEIKQVENAWYPTRTTSYKISERNNGTVRLKGFKTEVTKFELMTKLNNEDLSLDVFCPTLFRDGVNEEAKKVFFRSEVNEDGSGCHRLYPNDAKKLYNELQEIRKEREEALAEANGILLHPQKSSVVNQRPKKNTQQMIGVLLGIVLLTSVILFVVWKIKNRPH